MITLILIQYHRVYSSFLSLLYIYLSTLLDLCCCMSFSPVVVSWGYSSVPVASLVAEHGLQSTGSIVVVHRLCGTWDPPGSGIEPVSPALAGRLLTTEPQGSLLYLFVCAGSQLQHSESLIFVAACRHLFFFFFAAYGIQFPDQGLNSGPLHWECRVLVTGLPGKSFLVKFDERNWTGKSIFP